MGRILAIQLKTTPTPRFLVVLNVNRIQQNVQTTVLWGNSLLFSATFVSQDLYFGQQLAEWTGIPKTWAELSMVPNPPTVQPFAPDFSLIPQPPSVAPVAVATATLLASGFDPLQGFWTEFAGNYNLYFGLFQGNWYNTVGQPQR